MVYKMTLTDLIKASERRTKLLYDSSSKAFKTAPESSLHRYESGRAQESERYTEILRRLSDD